MSNFKDEISKLSFEDVVLDFKRIVAEKGEDYVYRLPDHLADECVYFVPSERYVEEVDDAGYCLREEYVANEDAGAPSCIVGHWFAEHGVTYDDVAEWNGAASYTALAEGLGVDQLDPRITVFLREAQRLQDRGSPWGEAFDYAFRAAAKFVESE